MEGQTSCQECLASNGKYSEEEGAERCEDVEYGYEIVVDTETERG